MLNQRRIQRNLIKYEETKVKLRFNGVVFKK